MYLLLHHIEENGGNHLAIAAEPGSSQGTLQALQSTLQLGKNILLEVLDENLLCPCSGRENTI